MCEMQKYSRKSVPLARLSIRNMSSRELSLDSGCRWCHTANVGFATAKDNQTAESSAPQERGKTVILIYGDNDTKSEDPGSDSEVQYISTSPLKTPRGKGRASAAVKADDSDAEAGPSSKKRQADEDEENKPHLSKRARGKNGGVWHFSVLPMVMSRPTYRAGVAVNVQVPACGGASRFVLYQAGLLNPNHILAVIAGNSDSKSSVLDRAGEYCYACCPA